MLINGRHPVFSDILNPALRDCLRNQSKKIEGSSGTGLLCRGSTRSIPAGKAEGACKPAILRGFANVGINSRLADFIHMLRSGQTRFDGKQQFPDKNKMELSLIYRWICSLMVSRKIRSYTRGLCGTGGTINSSPRAFRQSASSS